MLYPTSPARGGIRAWWCEHVTKPLESMYAQLDEHQHNDDQQ